MPSWLLKATVQGAISPLPGCDRLNYLLQKHVTGSLALTDEVFERKVAQCRRHVVSYRESRGGHALPSLALELGTGWYPIVPVGLFLAGVESVVTIDVSSLLDLERTRRVLDLFASQLRSERLPALLGPIAPDRAEAVIAAAGERTARDAGELLGRVGVRALVGDARASGLPAGCVELFVSNNTLEHIPPEMLAQLMAEFARLAAEGAVMDHFVDLSDHYAHFDGSITEFNYLRYSDRVWRLFNNRLQHQNRLRISDYRRIIGQAGFELVAEEAERGAPEELGRVRLARPFRGYAVEDLLVLRSWLTAVARPAGPAAA
jgi:SAM-dependent methyltransferase